MNQKNILLVIVPLSAFAILWVGFSIYHESVTSTISQTISTAIAPINPGFDTSIIDKLDKRTKITPVYQLKTGSPKSPSSQTPTGNLGAEPASNSASLTISPSASSSAASSQQQSSPSASQAGGI
ncbi:hypothetical protein M1615_05120 [Patescibacteria group bacterium]|nr:hypothetical protein [Patescibacteria group bacterium]MCL5010045.1 hypothetical protein [Patescibacteria group bacterium]